MLRRLLDTLTGAVVFPTVIEAADAVALHPTCRKLRAAMGTTKFDCINRPALTAIKREVFTHDPHGDRTGALDLLRQANRLPEHPHISSGQSSGTRMDEIRRIPFFRPPFARVGMITIGSPSGRVT